MGYGTAEHMAALTRLGVTPCAPARLCTGQKSAAGRVEFRIAPPHVINAIYRWRHHPGADRGPVMHSRISQGQGLPGTLDSGRALSLAN